MDYSSTYFITLLVFTHDKLAEALKRLVKFPWHGVYATPASLIRATNDVMLDYRFPIYPQRAKPEFLSHTLSLLVDIETFRRKSVLFRTGCWVCSLGRFFGRSHRIPLFPAGIAEEFPPQHWHCLVVYVWH